MSQTSLESGDNDNMFVGDVSGDDIIQRLVEHAQNVAFWVAAEIVGCGSHKVRTD